MKQVAQKGFSLIELMVAITISLILLVALSTIYLNASRSNTELAKTNEQIENGRFAIQVLENDIVHAGYWGDYTPQFQDLTYSSAPADAPDPAVPLPGVCLPYDTTTWDDTYIHQIMGMPVQTFNETPAGCGGVITNKQPNTDIVVVRHADTCLAGTLNCAPATAGELYFQTSKCQTTDVVPYILSSTDLDTLHERNCTNLVTDKRRLISNIYYIRDYANAEGDGIPTLMKSQFGLGASGALDHQTPTPLIEGIEGFSVELGVDDISETGEVVDNTAPIAWVNPETYTSPRNRGDGVPDGAFISCTTASPCTADKLSNVVAVKIYVLSRNKQATRGYIDTKTYQLGNRTLGPFNDNYKRHVFSTTIRLVNVAMRRETP